MNRGLREDVDILRRATGSFAGEFDAATADYVPFDTTRAEGDALESMCRVLREQGCQVAARTYRSSKRAGRVIAPGPSPTPKGRRRGA